MKYWEIVFWLLQQQTTTDKCHEATREYGLRQESFDMFCSEIIEGKIIKKAKSILPKSAFRKVC